MGCILVILYIVITYIKATHRKISCNCYFDVLLAVALWAVFFDGLTAWTVNHMNIVPEYVNRTVHLIFFVLMAERLFCIRSRIWITQSFVRLPMKWRDIIMRNIMAEVIRMVLWANRFHCMQELWRLLMCLMQYHKRGSKAFDGKHMLTSSNLFSL